MLSTYQHQCSSKYIYFLKTFNLVRLRCSSGKASMRVWLVQSIINLKRHNEFIAWKKKLVFHEIMCVKESFDQCKS